MGYGNEVFGFEILAGWEGQGIIILQKDLTCTVGKESGSEMGGMDGMI